MATAPKVHHYPSQVQLDPMPRREDTGFDPPRPGEERLWPAQGDEPAQGEGIDKPISQPGEPTPLSDERR